MSFPSSSPLLQLHGIQIRLIGSKTQLGDYCDLRGESKAMPFGSDGGEHVEGKGVEAVCPWTHIRMAQSCCISGKQERGAPHNFLSSLRRWGLAQPFKGRANARDAGQGGGGTGTYGTFHHWLFTEQARNLMWNF